MTTPTTPDVFKREQSLIVENRRLRALLADVKQDLEDGASQTAIARLRAWTG